MQRIGRDAPRLRVAVSKVAPDHSATRIDREMADVSLLGGGRMRARHGEDLVTFLLPERPTAAEMLHPFLAPAAAVMWQWRGHEALHAGAVQLGGIAVLLFGIKGAGKSTTLGWLAREAGLTVLSDDLAVIVDGEVLAGPRSVDLRSASWVPPGMPAVRRGERVRMTLGPAPCSLPLGGSVLLEWAPRLETVAVPPAERLSAYVSARSFGSLPPNTGTLLDLAALPMLVLRRRRELRSIEATGRAIIERFA